MLKYIDSIFDTEIEQEKEKCVNIKLSNYISFIPIHFNQYEGCNRFVIKKSQKAKLYLKSGKQLVYFSDADIIDIIINFDVDIAKWFFEQFIKIYNDEYIDVSFSINDKSFNGKGMDLYSQNKEFVTFTDTTMEINELVQLINYIISKDLQYGIDKAEIKDTYLKKTLRGYIAVIGSIVFKNEYCKQYLRSIGYQCPKKFNKYYFSKNKVLFENNSFDICQLM